jgi:hypothetical protein
MGAEVKSPPGNVCALTARFTILSHCYIQMIKVGRDTGTFTFRILPKQQQNGVENLSTKGIWMK